MLNTDLNAYQYCMEMKNNRTLFISFKSNIRKLCRELTYYFDEKGDPIFNMAIDEISDLLGPIEYSCDSTITNIIDKPSTITSAKPIFKTFFYSVEKSKYKEILLQTILASEYDINPFYVKSLINKELNKLQKIYKEYNAAINLNKYNWLVRNVVEQKINHYLYDSEFVDMFLELYDAILNNKLQKNFESKSWEIRDAGRINFELNRFGCCKATMYDLNRHAISLNDLIKKDESITADVDNKLINKLSLMGRPITCDACGSQVLMRVPELKIKDITAQKGDCQTYLSKIKEGIKIEKIFYDALFNMYSNILGLNIGIELLVPLPELIEYELDDQKYLIRLFKPYAKRLNEEFTVKYVILKYNRHKRSKLKII